MEWQALERAKMRAMAIEINWLLFLCVAPSHTGFKVSRDSERPMTNGEVEFNNSLIGILQVIGREFRSYVPTLLDIISFYCTTHP